MKILNKDVKPAEAPTATDSSTETKVEPVSAPKTNEEAPAVQPIDKETLEKEWENQPKVVARDGETSENKKEEEAIAEKGEEVKEVEGLSKAKDRLISELQVLRDQKKNLKSPVVDTTVEAEDEIDYQSPNETEDEKINRILDSRDAKNNFYNSHSKFYEGSDGVQNRQSVEDYINLKYNPKNMSASAVTELREMIHNKFFGAYDKNMTIQQAKDEARTEHIQNDLATMGSDKGKSFTKTQPKTRKRILPRQKGPETWYPINK